MTSYDPAQARGRGQVAARNHLLQQAMDARDLLWRLSSAAPRGREMRCRSSQQDQRSPVGHVAPLLVCELFQERACLSLEHLLLLRLCPRPQDAGIAAA